MVVQRIALGALALVAAFYAAAIVYLKVNETDLVFTRETAPNGLPPAADSLRLPYRTVTFRMVDSVVLTSWVVPSADSASGMWVLLCHGQTGNLATTTRPEYYAYLRAIGVHILATRTPSKRFVELGGAHHDAFLADSATYFGEYARFVAKLRHRSP